MTVLALATMPAPCARLPARRQAASQPRGRNPLGLRVMAAAGGVPGPAGPPSPPEPTPTPAGTPVYLRSTGAGGPLSGSGGTGGSAGYGSGGYGGSGGRPVGTGGSGGSQGGDGFNLPPGWTWDRILLIALGIALAIPAWRYLNRRFLYKPEPEHTLTKVEDAASDIKHKSAVSKATSAVKHATVDPVRDAVAYTTHAVKHNDAVRAVQHKGEDVKDTVDVNAHEAASKAERTGHKAKKETKQAYEDTKTKGKHAYEDAKVKTVHAAEHTKKGAKHAYEDTKGKAEDVGAAVDSKAHEAAVKGGRTMQRAKEAVEDAVYDAEHSAAKATKGMLEGIKGAATTVGRKLHIVADATEKGTKKAVNKAERKAGLRYLPAGTTSESERRNIYYVAGGVALGVGTLAALYYWDRKGGDLGGKMRKLQDRTKEAADTATRKARDVLRGSSTQEPSGPTRPQ